MSQPSQTRLRIQLLGEFAATLDNATARQLDKPRQRALLMEQKRYAEAEAVYREDLARNRDNGWGLLGLQNAIRAQKKNTAEAIRLSGQLAEAWVKADTLPSTSCYCAPVN